MASKTKRGQADSKIGLALAGGGLEGGVYEVGALCALQEAVEGLDLNDLDIYVGVSAGSFLAASLANGMKAEEMCRAIVDPRPGEHPFSSEIFVTPALAELWRRGVSVPRLLWEALRKYISDPRDRSLLDALTRLGRALPVGVFDNEPIRAYLQKVYSLPGRTDDFRELSRRLVIVAVDLDSGEAVRFGDPGIDHVSISRAVQASTALPGLYPPVEIDGRHYVDGVLRKTLHASVALDSGTDLVLCINPIVPVDTAKAVERGAMKRGKLIHRGLPSVLSQTFRILIYSRMAAGFASYEGRYGDAELLLIEPRHDDYRMFFNNIFSFASRVDVLEHAYRATRRDLRERQSTLAPLFARHGMRLRTEILDDKERSLQAQTEATEPSWRRGRARPEPRAVDVLDDLGRTLDRLDRLVTSPEPARVVQFAPAGARRTKSARGKSPKGRAAGS